MAKRRKLEAPSADDLSRMEAEFTAGSGARPAPIAQVAADSAGAFDPRSVEERAAAAKDRTDAQTFRDAQGRGLVMLELPVEEIDADALVRDRTVLDAEEMDELKSSIAANGLRLPVEVFQKPDGGFGLLSGYRRLRAVRELRALTGQPQYATIKAVLREPEAMGGTFAAMVEENEIRAGLSQFERGRIAVIAVQQGAFVNVEAAVNALFPMASKAKRSKVRSFALIFEELGDMLTFPDLIRERDGLKLATALRDGAESMLREALAARVPKSPEEEAELLTKALAQMETKADPARGGRPRAREEGTRVTLSSGVTLQPVRDGDGWIIRLRGRQVDRALVDAAMAELERLFEAD